MQQLNDFIRTVKKVSLHRHYRITGSYGVRDAFSYYRKTRPRESRFVLKDVEYFRIIREVNNLLADELRKSNTVTLPQNMGVLYGVKYSPVVEYRGKKLYTNHPVDFQKTLELWYRDAECRRRKTLVRSLDKEVFRLYWDKRGCCLKNKEFYQIIFNRALRLSIRELARQNKYDTYLLKS